MILSAVRMCSVALAFPRVEPVGLLKLLGRLQAEPGLRLSAIIELISRDFFAQCRRLVGQSDALLPAGAASGRPEPKGRGADRRHAGGQDHAGAAVNGGALFTQIPQLGCGGSPIC